MEKNRRGAEAVVSSQLQIGQFKVKYVDTKTECQQ